jgi:hypothetical protein
MNRMCANRRVESAQGLLLDYYGWRKDTDDVGILHQLYRDLPNTKGTQRRDSEDDDNDDDDFEAVHRAATRSRSTRSIACGYVKAMHTAIIVLGREVHPQCIVCPLTSAERHTLNAYNAPEDTLQGNRVTPNLITTITPQRALLIPYATSWTFSNTALRVHSTRTCTLEMCISL